MKKAFTRVIAALLAASALFSITSCNSNEKPDETTASEGGNEVATVPETFGELVYDESFSRTQASALDLSTLTFVNGNWTANDGKLTGSNTGQGDCFAMTDIKVDADTSFTLEADIQFKSGDAVGLVFGVKRPKAPSSAWYCVNVDRNNGNTRLFSVGTGDVGTVSSAQRLLTSEEKSGRDFHLALNVSAGGTISFSLDGVKVADFTDTTYAGGYLGFVTYNASTVISNIQYISYSSANLNSLSILNGELKNELSADNGFYRAICDFDVETLGLVLTSSDKVYVDGKLYPADAANVGLPLQYGENIIEIVTQNADGVQSASTLCVIRRPDPTVVYSDTYRAYLHFTPMANWMNDPNGLVYNEATGEYHLYFQYSPHDVESYTKTKVWGHAVSYDLMHWRELEVAIDTDILGAIWSGSCVVDKNNTSGFFDESTAPESRFVAIYTYDNQKQAVAYSPDGGYTWIKYEDNPVIASNPYTWDFRDPKVIWMEDTNQWLMIIAGGRAQIYTSTDLVNWKLNSALNYIDGSEIHTECPDLFPLAVDGDENNIKWVFMGGGTFYVVGDLVYENGVYKFVATQKRSDNYNGGSNVYATQSYYNDKEGRRILISWIQDYSASRYDDKNWNGLMTLPYETTLRTINGRICLVSYPVSELATLESDVIFSADSMNITGTSTTVASDSGVCKIDMTVAVPKSGNITLKLTKTAKVVYNVTTSVLTLTTSEGSYSASLHPDNGNITLTVYLDRSVVEVFGNYGEAAICALNYQDVENNTITLVSTEDTVVQGVKITKMNAFFE